MNKILVLLGFCLVFASETVNAQRHIVGTNHLDIQVGSVNEFHSNNRFFSAAFSRLSSRRTYWRIGGQYASVDLPVNTFGTAPAVVSAQTYQLQGMYFYTLFSLFNSSIYTNVGIGPFGGYERINNGDERINDAVSLVTKSPWIGGGRADVQLEAFLNSRWIITTNYAKSYTHGSSLSQWDDYFSLGLKVQLK